MPIHETDKPRLRHSLQMFNHAVDRGLATSHVATITTKAQLQTAITARAVHETDVELMRQINKAMDTAGAVGVFAGTGIADADTITGMRALWTNLDSGLSATDARSFQWT